MHKEKEVVYVVKYAESTREIYQVVSIHRTVGGAKGALYHHRKIKSRHGLLSEGDTKVVEMELLK